MQFKEVKSFNQKGKKMVVESETLQKLVLHRNEELKIANERIKNLLD